MLKHKASVAVRWLLIILVTALSITLLYVLTATRATTPLRRAVRQTPRQYVSPEPASPTGRHTLTTVFLIVMENHNWSDIYASPSAPYINKTLLPQASYARQYYNPPGNHPSEPNYLWLEAGTNFGIYDDSPPSVNHQSTTQHLVTILKNASVTWKSYQEDITGTTCPITDSGAYTTRHNPTVFFEDVTNANDANSAYCIEHERPYSELHTDLQKNTVARFNYIKPNLCNDMHDSCAPLYNPIQQGDTWLAKQLPSILNSQAYKTGGVIFITWDEGVGDDGPIGMIVLSPDAKGRGYSNTIHYTHSSTLRTLEEIFSVTPLLGDAVKATDLSDLFKQFP
jgi:phosphatidylinositol-3-phosphatase